MEPKTLHERAIDAAFRAEDRPASQGEWGRYIVRCLKSHRIVYYAHTASDRDAWLADFIPRIEFEQPIKNEEE